jgi:hypothetical protein
VITFVFRAESSAPTRVPDLTRTQKHGTEHPRALLLACVSLLFSFLTSLSRLCAWMICSGCENFACYPCYPFCTVTNCSHRHLVTKHPASARNPTTHNLQHTYLPRAVERSMLPATLRCRIRAINSSRPWAPPPPPTPAPNVMSSSCALIPASSFAIGHVLRTTHQSSS